MNTVSSINTMNTTPGTSSSFPYRNLMNNSSLLSVNTTSVSSTISPSMSSFHSNPSTPIANNYSFKPIGSTNMNTPLTTTIASVGNDTNTIINIIDPLLTNIFIKIRPYIILLTIFIMSSLALMVSVIMLITSSNN